jgi:hypothetical protein
MVAGQLWIASANTAQRVSLGGVALMQGTMPRTLPFGLVRIVRSALWACASTRKYASERELTPANVRFWRVGVISLISRPGVSAILARISA